MAEPNSTEIKTKVVPGVFTAARLTYGRVLRKMYRMKMDLPDSVKNLQPPYIVIGNHVNTFDPVLISVMFPRPIQWVAGDTLFRNPVLGFLLRNLAGSISKSKSRSDYYTIKEMTRIIRKDRGIVGVFPEGQRTWDGTTLPLYFSTSKLVRMLKVPVVVCILEGGYHTLPRWSSKRRPGRLVLSFKDPIMPESFAGKSAGEIHDMLTEALDFNAHEHQRKHKIHFKAKRRAEHLEHVLYMCPSCGSMATMVSDRNNIRCSRCGLDVHMDMYGFLESGNSEFSFTTVAEWNSWQLHESRKRLKEGYWSGEDIILKGDTAAFGKGYRDQKLSYFGDARVTMRCSALEAEIDNQVYRFDTDKMESVNVAFQRVFEFYYENELFRLNFPPPRSSAYKYWALYQCMDQVRNSQGEDGTAEGEGEEDGSESPA